MRPLFDGRRALRDDGGEIPTPSGALPGSNHRLLGDRDLVVVICASLDAALAGLLARRLCGRATEVAAFLGTDGDPGAPVAALGARVALARVTGTISEALERLLRTMKAVEAALARERATRLDDGGVRPQLEALRAELRRQGSDLSPVAAAREVMESAAVAAMVALAGALAHATPIAPSVDSDIPPKEFQVRELVTLDEVERRYVAHVLEQTGGKRLEAARMLGISYPTLLKRIREP